jgi:zinc protease
MTTTLTATETPSRASTVQKIVSKGGIEAWLVEDYAVPLIALEFAFKGGAAQDPIGKSGAATLLASLLDEGVPMTRRAFIAPSTRMRSKYHFPPAAIISVDACKA